MSKIFEYIADHLELIFGNKKCNLTLLSYLVYIDQTPKFELQLLRTEYVKNGGAYDQRHALLSTVRACRS